jgi:hypothetical protein
LRKQLAMLKRTGQPKSGDFVRLCVPKTSSGLNS